MARRTNSAPATPAFNCISSSRCGPKAFYASSTRLPRSFHPAPDRPSRLHLHAQRLEGEVEERHALSEHLAEVTPGVGPRQLEPGVGFARFGRDMHVQLAR